MKKILASILSFALITSPMSGVAASFGSSSSKSSTSSPSKSSSSSSSSSSSNSSKSYYSTPSKSSSSSSSNSSSSGSVGKGQSVGMTRSTVTNSVRSGNYTPPANNTTVAGNNPQKSNQSQNNYSNNSSYNNSSTSNYSNRQQPNYGNYNRPQQNYGYSNNNGFSGTTVAGALVAGALVGYMLHRDSTGNVYYTNPNQPNVAYDNQGRPMGTVPSGNYVNYGTIDGSGQLVQNSNYANTQPVNQSNSSGLGAWWIVILLVLGGIGFAIYRMLNTIKANPIMKDESFAQKTYEPNAEEKLRDNARTMFVNFQKNNRPSGIDFIKENSDSVLFEAIQNDVLNSSEEREVSVKSVEAQVVDISREGTKFVGSVRYISTIEEVLDGHKTQTVLDEVWHFLYEGNRWVVAGIEPVKPQEIQEEVDIQTDVKDGGRFHI